MCTHKKYWLFGLYKYFSRGPVSFWGRLVLYHIYISYWTVTYTWRNVSSFLTFTVPLTSQYHPLPASVSYTANNFSYMYSKKRFSQASLLISTKHNFNVLSGIMIFCREVLILIFKDQLCMFTMYFYIWNYQAQIKSVWFYKFKNRKLL